VENNYPVHEIAAAEETLEGFYLSLMENQRSGKATQTPPPVPA
jgi:hypothetical protein